MPRLLLPLALAALALPAAAQTVYTSTVGPATQVWDWDDAASWSPAGVPGPGDTAVIRSLVELDGDVTVARLEVRDGSLRGPGSVTVTASGEWTGGDLQSAPADDGALVVPAGVTFLVRDGLDKRFRGRDLLVDGTLDWEARDTVRVLNTSELHVRAGAEWRSREARIGHLAGSLLVQIDGTLRLTDGGQTVIDHDLGWLIVDGTLRVEDHTLTLGNAGSAFTAGGTGTIDVQRGRLQVTRGAYDFSGTHLVGSPEGKVTALGGRLTLGTAGFFGLASAEGGELFFGQPPGLTEITRGALVGGSFGGVVEGAGARITFRFEWVRGKLERLATLEVGPTADFVITSPMGVPNEREFAGGALLNLGNFIWETDDDIAATGLHDIVNVGSIILQTDGDLVRGGGVVRLANEGLFAKLDGAGESRWDTEFGGFVNRGIVSVDTGTLAVERSPENGPDIGEPDTGVWTAKGGAELVFLRRRRFGEGSVLDGTGRVDLTGLDVGSAYAATLSPGLRFPEDARAGTLTVAGDLPALTGGGLEIELGRAAAPSGDVVAVGGRATLGGTLAVRLLPGFAPAVGDRLRFLTATGGVTGAFDALDLPAGVSATVETDADGADLVVTAVVSADAAGDAPALTLAAHPNPARGRLGVRFALPAPGPARVALHDALGREVAVLADGPHAAGAHEAALDAAALAPGVYVVRLAAGGRLLARPVTVVR